MDTITTRQRRLEQFLYMHGIDFLSCYKDDDGMTVWVYEANDRVRELVDEFRRVMAARAQRKGA